MTAFGEYGYMEEGHLGKPYDLRLLRRLARYTLPYKRTAALALCLTLVITLIDLAVPYLTKIAIDRYILAAWYTLDIESLAPAERKALEDRFAGTLEENRDGSLWVLSHEAAKGMDPALRHALESRGAMETGRFYRVDAAVWKEIASQIPAGEGVPLSDGGAILPYASLEQLPPETVERTRSGDLTGVLRIAAFFFVLLLFSFGLSYLEYVLLEYVGQHVMQDIRVQLFKTMTGQAVRFFDRHPLGRLVTRMTNDIDNLNEMFKSVVITVFKDLFLLTGILIVLLSLNWRLALVAFIFLPFIFGITLLFSRLAREAFRELRATVAKINAFLQERISGMRVIQLFVQERRQMETFREINQANYLAGMRQIKVFALFMPLMELFSSLAVAILIWYGGGKVVQDELTLGALVAFIGYMQMFFKPIRDISEKYNIMQSAMASTERIFEFMDQDETIPEHPTPYEPQTLRGEVAFRDVSFAYEKDQPVLKHVSFEVNPGETLAIVGATGSGKTTIINLLERFYDPDEGAVVVDGKDLREWSASALHRRMSLCMQDVFIFAGTLAENIALGREDLGPEAVREAASKANALSFIERLPGGLSQTIGEGGATLSAGERQLLSFARALAADPPVLILDEATSSVDPETERLIQEAITRMASRRTTLIVAHRLSTIRHADRILVMHHGRICEQGDHDALMARKGIYYKLSRLRSDV